MYLRSGEKKALAIITAVAVLFVAVVGTAVFLLVRDAPREHQPYLHVATDDGLHQIDTVRWCDLFLRGCDPPLDRPQRDTPHVPVPIGTTAVLSVSTSIGEGPWTLIALYSTPRGPYEDEKTYASGSRYTVILRSRPDSVLLGITVNLPSAIINQDGTLGPARGVLAVDTKPADYMVPEA